MPGNRFSPGVRVGQASVARSSLAVVTGAADLQRLDATALMRWAAVTRASFAESRAEIDALNVFPVPDGDTGTNLYLTLDGALDATRTALERRARAGERPGVAEMCREMSRAMLLTARGNSGVILSQLFRGFAESVVEAAEESIDGAGLAEAFARADRLAWRAVTQPKEGTILSVSRATAAASAALVADRPRASLAEVVDLAARTAAAALDQTPTQLPVLARAGVVDAGGAGYLLLVEALQRVVDGGHPGPTDDPLRRRHGWSQGAHPPTPHPPGDALPAGGPAYEVMYLLDHTDQTRVDALRDRLDALGDSLLVVGGDDDVWTVHVHVDDAGAAIEAGLAAGRPHRVSVTYFAEQSRRRTDPDALAVVACAAGDGLAETLRAAGATVVMSGPGGRAAAGEVLAAIRSTHAGRVVLLPNDADTELAARAAARAAADEQVDVRIVPSRSAVQGLSALAVLDAGADFEDIVATMTAAAEATRHGAVTVAHKEAVTAAGVCHVGDVLGAVGGEFVVIGDDLARVAGQVVDRLLGPDGELLTVVTGAQAPPDLATSVIAGARLRRRDLEVVLVHGGQPLYPLLLGVE